MTQVKICGIRRVEDALVAAEAGADYLGFVFYERSRRRVRPDEAREIISAVRKQSDARAVGVFVNEDPAGLNRIARAAGLDYVQLSGDEPDDIIEALDVPAIQVIHMRDDMTPEALIERVLDTPADLVMLDTAAAGSYGGTGEAFDWSRVPAVPRPLLLAGGLHAGNVADAVRHVHPWGVDVSSGVETNGDKDPDRIRAFIQAARHSSPSSTK